MEEFTSIAVWILITFLAINAGVFWFANTDTFIDNGLAIGIAEDTSFNASSVGDLNASFFGTDCSTVSATDLAIAPCAFLQVGSFTTKIYGALWNFLTGWVNLLNAILPNWIPASGLFKAILIPILAVIQIFSIFVILLKVAGIVRGGS